MQNVNVTANISDREIDRVFSVLCDFKSYSTLCPSVRSIKVHESAANEKISDWEVNFNNGILKWQERDVFDHGNREIHFNQIAGDIDHFSGIWRVIETHSATQITFNAQFDLGLPMLADMLNPIAEKAIKENISAIISGLFASSVLTDGLQGDLARGEEHHVA